MGRRRTIHVEAYIAISSTLDRTSTASRVKSTESVKKRQTSLSNRIDTNRGLHCYHKTYRPGHELPIVAKWRDRGVKAAP
jgi:hypothetical protein